MVQIFLLLLNEAGCLGGRVGVQSLSHISDDKIVLCESSTNEFSPSNDPVTTATFSSVYPVAVVIMREENQT